MTQAPQVNGFTSHPPNGLNGPLKAATPQAPPAPAPPPPPPPPPSDPSTSYLNGYTLEQVVAAHPVSDPYFGAILPPYARPPPLNLDSFRTGHDPTPDELAAEIATTYEGQLPLSHILDLLIQKVYYKLTESAEVMPGYDDMARKKELITWAQESRKQVIKVFAISKWARSADDVQRALNILSYLNRCGKKVEIARDIIRNCAGGLVPAKRRNYDISTALEVLVTGNYQKLPTIMQEVYHDHEPITDDEVITTMKALDDVLLHRLRLREIVPIGMHQSKIADGRVTFVVPNLFEVTMTVTGPDETDYWFALDMKFLVTANGEDPEASTEFPSEPHPWLKNQIISGVNQLLDLNSDKQLDIGEEGFIPNRQARDPSRIDTPLIRAYNMLQMLSLSYELEILHHQAIQMMKLGWQDFTTVTLEKPSRKSFSVVYWKRPPSQPLPGQGVKPPDPIAPHGGTITFSIVTSPKPQTRKAASKVHVDRLLALLEQTTKTRADESSPARTPSDEVERVQLRVDWAANFKALSIDVAPEDMQLELAVDPTDVDLPSILRKVTHTHARAILRSVMRQLQGPSKIIGSKDDIQLVEDEATGCTLQIRLCGSQSVILSVDERTGRINLKDVGVFGASNRSGRFLTFTAYVNKRPDLLIIVLRTLKSDMIFSEIEQQARYLGLQATKNLALPQNEIKKFGDMQNMIFIRLASFQDYYLAIIATKDELKTALVNVKEVVLNLYRMRVIEDFGWLNTDHIGGAQARHQRWLSMTGVTPVSEGNDETGPEHLLTMKTEILRELYAFCCARVSHTKVEQQLKTRGIPWSSVFTTSGLTSPPAGPLLDQRPTLSAFSSTARSVPKICIRIGDVVRSQAANNVAYENVKIKIVDWWSEKPCRVITSVRLRDIQPVSSGATGREKMLDPSHSITYDAETSIVSFVSHDINTCVDEFIEEWERVQRVAGIVREVGQTRNKRCWLDIRILSFNLQKVEFVYHSAYAVSIQWVQSSGSNTPGQGLYEMDFFTTPSADVESDDNPHHEISSFLSNRLRIDAGGGKMGFAVEALILILRQSLPVLLALQKVKQECPERVTLIFKSEIQYRLLIDYKHGLDFRILSNNKVNVSDIAMNALVRKKAIDNPLTPITPIPGLKDAVRMISQDQLAMSPSKSAPPVADNDVGLICSGSIAAGVVQRLCGLILNPVQPPS